jgi:hypothetical protein
METTCTALQKTRLPLNPFHLFYFVFLLIAISATGGTLRGTYTIDSSLTASAGNYKNFNSAVSDLKSGTRADGGPPNGPGISGNVSFLVANGVYNEQLNISAITGAHDTSQISFISASGDSTKVILSSLSSSSSTNNYTLLLNGAKYIVFKQITIARTGNAKYGRVIDIHGGSCSNQFISNRITGVKAIDVNPQELIYSQKDKDTANIFKNNLLKYGSYGFYMAGNSNSFEQRTVIDGNTIDSSYMSGVYLAFQEAPIVNANNISNIYADTCSGIYLANNSKKARITKNIIILPGGTGYGIYVGAFSGTSAAPALIANNMISIYNRRQGSSNNYSYYTFAYGIYNIYSAYTNFYYNSVSVNSSTYYFYSACFFSYSGYGYSGGATSLVNNCFANLSSGFAAVTYDSSITRSDYNDFYSKGTYLAYWGNGYANNLTGLKTASGMNTHSISKDPVFLSATNLRLYNSALNGKASPSISSTVSDDILGNTRGIKPDIGALEFEPYHNDAGVVNIGNGATNYCTGGQAIKVTLKNFGSSPLDTVTIHWTINGASQSPYGWSGSLAFDSTAIVNIGSYSFTSGGTYNIIAWAENPNSITDSSNSNDTAKAINIKQGMAGAYTIGGSGADFASFSGAANSLNQNGLCGAVTFNVADGIYTEQIELEQIINSSSANKITFQSASGDSSKVIISLASTSVDVNDNYVIRLNGADFVTIKNITLRRTGTVTNFYGRLLEVRNGSHNNNFLNCRFLGLINLSYNAYYGYYGHELVYSPSDNDSNNQFRNNLMKYGSYPFLWYGDYNAFYGTGTYERSTVIEGNIIDSTFGYGSIFEYQDGLSIKNNIINNVSGDSNNYGYGMELYLINNLKEITGNKITIITPLYYGYGLIMYVSHNTKKNPALIANNMIVLGSNSQSGAYGIYEYDCPHHNFYYNSILINASHNASPYTYGGLFYNYSGDSLVFENNCIANKAGG